MKKNKSILVLILTLTLISVTTHRIDVLRVNSQEASNSYIWHTNTRIKVTTSTDSLAWWTGETYSVTIRFEVLALGDGVNYIYDFYFDLVVATETHVISYMSQGPYEFANEGDVISKTFDYPIKAEDYELDEGWYIKDVPIQYNFELVAEMDGPDQGLILGDWEYDLKVTISHPYPPELTVYTIISPSTIAVGGTFILKVEVENVQAEIVGVRPAKGVIVNLALPSGLSAVSVSKTIGEVKAKRLVTFDIHADQVGTYSIQIEVTADNAKSISTSQTVNVLTPPQLSSTASLSPSTIKEGESATLTVGITNTGEQTAEDVKITITLPTGLSMTNPTRIVGNVQTIKQEMFSITGDAPGTYTITILVGASNTQSQSITATLIVEETPTPETTSESTPPEETTPPSEKESGFIPGFATIPTLLGLSVWLLVFQRHRKK